MCFFAGFERKFGFISRPWSFRIIQMAQNPDTDLRHTRCAFCFLNFMFFCCKLPTKHDPKSQNVEKIMFEGAPRRKRLELTTRALEVTKIIQQLVRTFMMSWGMQSYLLHVRAQDPKQLWSRELSRQCCPWKPKLPATFHGRPYNQTTVNILTLPCI